MSPPLLETRALKMHFGAVKAVDGVDLSIPRGVCFGLLGPNGAGKTTTIELMEGIKTPSAGEVLFCGEALGQAFKERAGIMFQHTALQDYVRVDEVLRLFSRLYQKNIPLERIIEQCALKEFLNRDTRKLSGGQRQRLLLGIALINDPDILFLDEPTTGLDPQARRNLWRTVESIKAEGKTIVLTTHYMDEAYALCDTIAIMDHGRVIAEGTPDELLAQHFDDSIMQLPWSDFQQGEQLDGMDYVQSKDQVLIHTKDVNETLADLVRRGIPLKHLRIRARNLEDLFIELTGRELRT